MPVGEVVKEEMDKICKKNPHMKGVYDGITKSEYAKMLRNRISALKSRIKKKSEERELKMLRTMARRLYLLKRFNLMPVKEFELLKIENDDEFEAIVNYLTTKKASRSDEAEISQVDIVPSLNHFLPEQKRPLPLPLKRPKLASKCK